MPISPSLKYSLQVAFTTSLVSPLLYLALAGSHAASEASFAMVWMLATMGTGSICAALTALIFDKALIYLSGLSLTTPQIKLLLSVLGVLLCAITMITFYGWHEFDTIYYKLFVTYSTIAVCGVWSYPLKNIRSEEL